jgi:hypothetical protein
MLALFALRLSARFILRLLNTDLVLSGLRWRAMAPRWAGGSTQWKKRDSSRDKVFSTGELVNLSTLISRAEDNALWEGGSICLR